MKRYDGYSARYADFYDLATKEWCNASCGDPTCTWCKDRPATAHGLPNDVALLVLSEHTDSVLH